LCTVTVLPKKSHFFQTAQEEEKVTQLYVWIRFDKEQQHDWKRLCVERVLYLSNND